MIIAPSLLSADFSRLGEEIQSVVAAGADWLHLDVMDGHYVPNLTIGPPVIKALRRCTKATFDVHLMIEQPERSIHQYLDAGADIITVHAEATTHLHRTLGQIREGGAKVGVSLNPGTPIASIQHVLHMVDLVLIMTVNPGFGGQQFIREMVPKVRQLRALLDDQGLNPVIEVDGGITADTIHEISHAGANAFVAGSFVFGNQDYKQAIDLLRKNAEV